MDTDWAEILNVERHTRGTLSYLVRRQLVAKSVSKKTVALSSTEAEYMALAKATKESILLSRFLEEINFRE